ncbi:MAG: Mur ligase family protein, partial [Oscillospiraceae bacterium]
MNIKIQEFWQQLQGKRVAFIGAGVSHKSLIQLFSDRGAVVTLCDKKPLQDFGEYADTLEKLKVRLSLGENYLDGLKNQDIIMRTPGFEFFTKELQAQAENAKITSEMELFFELCPCKIYGVTGSDGKTTTTSLIAKMLEESGQRVHLGGNIGRALLPIIDDVQPNDFAVVELSSFQLISMKQSPDVAVVTNVTPNHLDHHKDMQEYIDAKRN